MFLGNRDGFIAGLGRFVRIWNSLFYSETFGRIDPDRICIFATLTIFHPLLQILERSVAQYHGEGATTTQMDSSFSSPKVLFSSFQLLSSPISKASAPHQDPEILTRYDVLVWRTIKSALRWHGYRFRLEDDQFCPWLQQNVGNPLCLSILRPLT